MYPFVTRLIQCGLILLFAIEPGHAEERVAFGQTAVSDRSDATRAAALPAALADALRRLTPADAPGDSIDTAAALAADETLLQRFDYTQVTRPTASGIPSIKLMLRAWFHAAPVRALLVRAGIPVWRGGEVAPTIWWLEGSGSEKRLIDGRNVSTHPDFVEALVARGVRPLWAVNDLDDWRMAESLAREDDVPPALAEAAARAGADPAVLAWIRADEAGATEIVWFIHAVPDADARFATSGPDLSAALAAAVPELIDIFAQRHAVRAGAVADQVREVDRGAGEYVVWLENLTRAGDYAEAIGLLQSQSIVASLTPEQAMADRVRLRLRITTPLSELLALLAADGRLALSPAPPEGADLALRWQN